MRRSVFLLSLLCALALTAHSTARATDIDGASGGSTRVYSDAFEGFEEEWTEPPLPMGHLPCHWESHNHADVEIESVHALSAAHDERESESGSASVSEREDTRRFNLGKAHCKTQPGFPPNLTSASTTYGHNILFNRCNGGPDGINITGTFAAAKPGRLKCRWYPYVRSTGSKGVQTAYGTVYDNFTVACPGLRDGFLPLQRYELYVSMFDNCFYSHEPLVFRSASVLIPGAISTLSKTSSYTTDEEIIEVNGVDFVDGPGLMCKFGSRVVKATFVSSTRIMCKTPRHEQGIVKLRVANDGVHYSCDYQEYEFRHVCKGGKNTCHSHGKCVDGRCFCDKGWHGRSCFEKNIPAADDWGHFAGGFPLIVYGVVLNTASFLSPPARISYAPLRWFTLLFHYEYHLDPFACLVFGVINFSAHLNERLTAETSGSEHEAFHLWASLMMIGLGLLGLLIATVKFPKRQVDFSFPLSAMIMALLFAVHNQTTSFSAGMHIHYCTLLITLSVVKIMSYYHTVWKKFFVRGAALAIVWAGTSLTVSSQNWVQLLSPVTTPARVVGATGCVSILFLVVNTLVVELLIYRGSCSCCLSEQPQNGGWTALVGDDSDDVVDFGGSNPSRRVDKYSNVNVNSVNGVNGEAGVVGERSDGYVDRGSETVCANGTLGGVSNGVGEGSATPSASTGTATTGTTAVTAQGGSRSALGSGIAGYSLPSVGGGGGSGGSGGRSDGASRGVRTLKTLGVRKGKGKKPARKGVGKND